ncbi:hypothetical protein Q8A73_011487 [Channa argus]|nr:hypothetical protein Q8A73_011487 [Channa argus]
MAVCVSRERGGGGGVVVRRRLPVTCRWLDVEVCFYLGFEHGWGGGGLAGRVTQTSDNDQMLWLNNRIDSLSRRMKLCATGCFWTWCGGRARPEGKHTRVLFYTSDQIACVTWRVHPPAPSPSLPPSSSSLFAASPALQCSSSCKTCLEVQGLLTPVKERLLHRPGDPVRQTVSPSAGLRIRPLSSTSPETPFRPFKSHHGFLDSHLCSSPRWLYFFCGF